MGIPDPRSEVFDVPPAGKLRVVAWRQRTQTWPHPDLVPIHAERSTLLHWWASAYDLSVEDWGATDAERPAEYVELLIDVAQAALTTALGALATGYVQRFFERRKAKPTDGTDGDPADTPAVPPPDVRPLMSLTIVNECGGTVIVLDAAEGNEVARAVGLVADPEWRGRLTLQRDDGARRG